MEIPALVEERLGDEEIRAGVSLGDEDVLFSTASRTLLYRGEGLLSDESVTELPHEVERFDLSEGRRKTKFSLTYVDGTESFTVPGNRGEKVLELLFEGIPRVACVVEADESIRGVYRFSELTVIVGDGRLVKHIGSSVWDADYEEFAFEDVTGLDFEEGSVATQIVLAIDGRPQRIKAPNDAAPMLRQTLQEALFDYHGVASLDALNEAVAPAEADAAAQSADSGGSSDLTLDEGIDPLVGGSAEETDREEPASTAASTTGDTGGSGEPAESQPDAGGGVESDNEPRPTGDGDAVSSADLAAVDEQLETLTTAVKNQNELLEKQQRTIERLIEELRQGR